MSHRTFDDATSIQARQALLDNRCEHGQKRHRTRKRKARLNAVARAMGEHKRKANMAKCHRLLAITRAFWRGDRDDMKGATR